MTIHHFCKDRGVIVQPLIKALFIVVLLFRGMYVGDTKFQNYGSKIIKPFPNLFYLIVIGPR